MSNRYTPESREAQVEAFLAHVRAEAGRLGVTMEQLAERLLPRLTELHLAAEDHSAEEQP